MESTFHLRAALGVCLITVSLSAGPDLHAQAAVQNAKPATAVDASDARKVEAARREFIGREFRLVSSNLRINRVTRLSQRKLQRALELSTDESRRLIDSALDEIQKIPTVNAVCSREKMKPNLGHRGRSMMLRDDFGFVFRPDRTELCSDLSMREIDMQPVELTESSLKLKIKVDQNLVRTATCNLVSVDGPVSALERPHGDLYASAG